MKLSLPHFLTASDTLRVDAPFCLVAIVATLGAVLGAAPYVLDRGPSPKHQLETINERRTLAASLEAELAGQRQQVAELAAKSQEAVHLQPATATIGRIVEISDVARTTSVSIPQISPQTAVPATVGAPRVAVTIIPIKIAGSATYADAAHFLHALRTRFHDTAVTAFHITAAPSDDSPTASFTADLAWYAAPASSTVSADASPKSP